MIYRHIFVVRSVIDTIRQVVRKAPPRTETGGPLAGYISLDGAIVVTHAGGPGPNANLSEFSVTVDGAYAQKFCDQVRRASGGLFDYIGDWHLHPGWSLRASSDDVTAMRRMASWGYCPVKHPVSLIYRSYREKYVLYALNDQGRLDYVPSSEIDQVPD